MEHGLASSSLVFVKCIKRGFGQLALSRMLESQQVAGLVYLSDKTWRLL